MYSTAIDVNVVNGANTVTVSPPLAAAPALGDALLIGGAWHEVVTGTVSSIELVENVTAATGTQPAMLLRFTSGKCSPTFAADTAYQLAKMNQKLGAELFQFLTQPNPVAVHDYTADENTLVTIQAASYIQSIYPNVSMTYAGDSIPKSDKRGEIDIMWFDSETFRLVDLLHTSSLVSSPIYAQIVAIQDIEGDGPATVMVDINHGRHHKIFTQQATLDISLNAPLVPALATKKIQAIRITVYDLIGSAITFTGATVSIPTAAEAILAETTAGSVVVIDLEWVPPEDGAGVDWLVTGCTVRYPLGLIGLNMLTPYQTLVDADGGFLYPINYPSIDYLTLIGSNEGYASGYQIASRVEQYYAASTDPQDPADSYFIVGPFWRHPLN